MALDSKGSFHMNPQIASMHSKAAPAKSEHGKGKKFEAEKKHDGSFTSNADGETQDHADIQGVHSHLDQAFGGGHPQLGKADDGAY